MNKLNCRYVVGKDGRYVVGKEGDVVGKWSVRICSLFVQLVHYYRVELPSICLSLDEGQTSRVCHVV